MPRIEIAVAYADGTKEVVSVGRPADLIAFADEFEKVAPDGPYVIRESTWLVHRALRVEKSFAEWIDTLEEVELVGREASTVAEPAATEAELGETVVLPPPQDPTAVGAWPAPAKTVEAAHPDEWPYLRPNRRIATRTGTSSPA
jgi:hypothetical protein